MDVYERDSYAFYSCKDDVLLFRHFFAECGKLSGELQPQAWRSSYVKNPFLSCLFVMHASQQHVVATSYDEPNESFIFQLDVKRSFNFNEGVAPWKFNLNQTLRDSSSNLNGEYA